MNQITNHNELLKNIDFYNQLLERQSTLPWLTHSNLNEITALRNQSFRELDDLTRPHKRGIMEILAEKIAMRNLAPKTVTHQVSKVGYKLNGEFTPCTCCLDIWRRLLKRLWNDYPDKRDVMAVAAKQFGHNRKYISSDRKSLFLGKDDRWIRKHSRELVDGWYMDINVTPERIHKILPAVVSSVGLKWGEDAVVIWN